MSELEPFVSRVESVFKLIGYASIESDDRGDKWIDIMANDEGDFWAQIRSTYKDNLPIWEIVFSDPFGKELKTIHLTRRVPGFEKERSSE